MIMWFRRRRVTQLLRSIAGNRSAIKAITEQTQRTQSINGYQQNELARMSHEVGADEAELRELITRWPELNTVGLPT